jgi:hypothetical protein
MKNDFGVFMIKKVVNKTKLDDSNGAARDLEYWLSRPVAERFSAVEILRRQVYGDSERLQRVIRVSKLSQS